MKQYMELSYDEIVGIVYQLIAKKGECNLTLFSDFCSKEIKQAWSEEDFIPEVGNAIGIRTMEVFDSKLLAIGVYGESLTSTYNLEYPICEKEIRFFLKDWFVNMEFQTGNTSMALEFDGEILPEVIAGSLEARRYFTAYKSELVRQFRYCDAIAEEILSFGKTKEIQTYAKRFAEIESPLSGETDAPWIRINYGDIYIFLHDNGDVTYQLDPLGGYGAELIDVTNAEKEEFIKKILSLEPKKFAKLDILCLLEPDGKSNVPMFLPLKSE